ncbi:Heavy metal-associated isoprenylated plant protein [Quillaja saponaria]|uniref:Heavy metal-associated isoprenylated plant protein n=1 Tax=Quillaja saponaria TaxID=32244 RepID=A0AAD7KZ84_QUISA|nr:Heavy metal-associated isoprenylated plant protein [Quillaja saponaria]
MGEKKMNDGQKKVEKSKKNGDGGKKEENIITVVCKIDMHCEGCASKILKTARRFEGVETVKAELDSNKLTATGKIDPVKIRDKLTEKIKKKVELISPQPKKENKADTKEKKSDDKDKKGDDKKTKEKEPPVTTAVLKVLLHCQGCIEKIRKMVSKTKGVHDFSIDKEKDTLTVKGSMDAKALAENLKEKLKRKVEVVPPKQEKEKEKGGNGDGGKKKGGGENGGQQEEKTSDHNGGGKMEANKMEVAPGQVYGYGYGYGPVYMEHMHAPQMFSDENPNACSVM